MKNTHQHIFHAVSVGEKETGTGMESESQERRSEQVQTHKKVHARYHACYQQKQKLCLLAPSSVCCRMCELYSMRLSAMRRLCNVLHV